MFVLELDRQAVRCHKQGAILRAMFSVLYRAHHVLNLSPAAQVCAGHLSMSIQHTLAQIFQLQLHLTEMLDVSSVLMHDQNLEKLPPKREVAQFEVVMEYGYIYF